MGFFQPVEFAGVIRNFGSFDSLPKFEDPVRLFFVVLRNADLLLTGIITRISRIFGCDPIHPKLLAHLAAGLQTFLYFKEIFPQPRLMALIQMNRNAIDDGHRAVFRFLTMIFFLLDSDDFAEKATEILIAFGRAFRVFEENRVVLATTDQETVGGLEVGPEGRAGFDPLFTITVADLRGLSRGGDREREEEDQGCEVSDHRVLSLG